MKYKIQYSGNNNINDKLNVLVTFIGLPRSYKENFSNIQKNLLNESNKKKFNFDIGVNTTLGKVQNTNKRNIIDLNIDEKIYDDMIKLYSPKFIMNYKINPNEAKNNGTIINFFRIKNVFENIKEKYDYYIFIRTDVKLNKEIDLEKYCKEDKISIILESRYNRGSHWSYTRDWDMFWIGNKEIFEKFIDTYKYEKEERDALRIKYSNLDCIHEKLFTICNGCY